MKQVALVSGLRSWYHEAWRPTDWPYQAIGTQISSLGLALYPIVACALYVKIRVPSGESTVSVVMSKADWPCKSTRPGLPNGAEPGSIGVLRRHVGLGVGGIDPLWTGSTY
jgi:hypothetical protein